MALHLARDKGVAYSRPIASSLIAGKHRSHRKMRSLLEPGLPAMNDNAVYLINRATQFAGKPRSNGKCDPCWSRDCPRRTMTRFV